MGRTGDTKRKIVEMLEQKNETLTDISNKLGLAPSTVSQHLQELQDAGTIRLVEDRPRKWKYYEMNRGQITRGFGYDISKDLKRIGVPIAVIAVALILAFAFYTSGSSSNAVAQAQQVYLAPGSVVPAGSTVITLSDSPSFYNISSLVVTVSNASIRSESTGKWYKIPLQASTFDLIQLKNISGILSGVKLSNGIYDGLVLNISGVSATVNGTKQNVDLPTGKLLIVGNFNITNGITNWINLDFDLAHSLHISANGTIVMLPVINVRHVEGSNLELNESSIIIARSPGDIKGFEEFGMDENGSMMNNFSAPQNISVWKNKDGKLRFNGSGSVPIIIRTGQGLIIGGDARSLLNATEYWNTTSNISSNTIAGEAAIIGGGCFGPMPEIAVNSASNITIQENAAIRRCCTSPEPLINMSDVAGVNIQSGNATVITSRFRAYPPIIRCCYPVYVDTGHGKAVISRCTPIYYNTTNSNGGVMNVSAQGLNNGSYQMQWNGWANSSMIDISAQNNNVGGFNARCSFENGALSCNSNQSLSVKEIDTNIGSQSGWAGIGVQSTGPQGHEGGSGPNAISTREIVVVNSSANSTSNSTGLGNVTGRLVIKGGTCLNLTMGEC